MLVDPSSGRERVGRDGCDDAARAGFVRAFRPDPVPGDIRAGTSRAARHAPSGGNLQPWRVYALAGEPLAHSRRWWRDAHGKPQYASIRPICGSRSAPAAMSAAEISTAHRHSREDRPGAFGSWPRTSSSSRSVGLFFCLDRNLGPPQWAMWACIADPMRWPSSAPRHSRRNSGPATRDGAAFVGLPMTTCLLWHGLAIATGSPINTGTRRDPSSWASCGDSTAKEGSARRRTRAPGRPAPRHGWALLPRFSARWVAKDKETTRLGRLQGVVHVRETCW